MEPINADPTVKSPELVAIVGDVLGELAFMVGDDESVETLAGAVWMECGISYRGPFAGTLRCWCTRDFATQLVANLLGTDAGDETTLDETGDALCEFMNVVCGQLVTAWHGADPVFDLSIPTVVECDETPRLEPDKHTAACQLTVSGEPFFCVYDKVSD